MPGGDEVRPDADVHHLPIGQRLFPERLRLRQILWQRERVVDQDVEPALIAFDPLEQPRDLVVIAMVDLHGNTFATAAVDFLSGFAHRTRERIRAGRHRAAGDIHGRPFRTERKSYSLADATTRTGDDRDFSCERSHLRLPPEEGFAVVADCFAAVIVAQRHTHHALGPFDGRPKIVEPVVEHRALGDSPTGPALVQPVEVTPADDRVAVPLVRGQAVVGGHMGFSQGGAAAVLNHALPNTCWVTGIAGEPGTTQSRYSSKDPANIPRSIVASGQKDPLM